MYLFITHDIGVVETIAGEVEVIQEGRVEEAGPGGGRRACSGLHSPHTRARYSQQYRGCCRVRRFDTIAATSSAGGGPPRGGLQTYTHCMRLTAAETSKIRETVRAVTGPRTRVHLFGSRTDDTAKGGDIDLLVEIDHSVDSPVLLGARIGARLQAALGERRIDVVLAAPNVAEQTIHRVARATGVELWTIAPICASVCSSSPTL